MFQDLTLQPADSLLALIGEFNRDARPEKVDLGVGVYRNSNGQTPVFRAVKAAEQRIRESQTTKTYIGPEGDQVFLDRLWELVSRSTSLGETTAAIQSVGGSGALRLAADLARQSGTGRIWVGTPTWPNHEGIFAATALRVSTYPFFDIATQTVRFDRMMSALGGAEKGDVALLHACCHNPTGAHLSSAQWRELIDLIQARGILPLIDLAYQGFGRGLQEDAAGLREAIAHAPEAMIAVSSSKNFGLYRERTGALFVTTASAATAKVVRSHLVSIARVSYSMPPDHGAAVVRAILSDEVLRRDWESELATMRDRIVALRARIASIRNSDYPSLHSIVEQEGMFSMLPVSPDQIQRLKVEQGIYMPASGRINIAGLHEAQVESVIERIFHKR
jgi:aromatic-amino-acid transaminase